MNNNIAYKDKGFYLLLLLLCIMLAIYGASLGPNLIGIVAIGIISFLLLTVNPELGFLILIAMIPYGNCWRIGSNSVRGFICIFPIFQILKKYKISRKKIFVIPVGILLIVIEVINESLRCDFFSIINTISPLLYIIFLAIVKSDSFSWDLERISYTFVISTLVSDITTLSVGGGINSYNNSIDYYRFGQESSMTFLAGSMQIPIFSCVSVFFLFVIIINGKNDTIGKKIINWIFVALHILFGILTVSRVLVLGMLVVGFVFFLNAFSLKNIMRSGRIVLSLLIVIGMLYYIFYDLINILIHKYFFRFNSSSVFSESNGRTFIWNDCIDYLSTHIKALFFGEGIISYPVIGKEKGFMFSFMAHNLYLDVLMAVGIIGFLCLSIIFISLIKKQKNVGIISVGVLLVIGAIFLVDGTLNYIWTYMYIILGIIFFNNYKSQFLENGRNRK